MAADIPTSTVYDCAREVLHLLSRVSHHILASRTLKSLEERNAAAKRNSEFSPLLRLPPELRNIIYTHVLGDRTIYVAPVYTYDSHDTPYELSLPLVCSQIFAESQPILRARTAFRFDYIFDLEVWVTRHSQMQREAVRIVTINGTVDKFLGTPCKGLRQPMTFYLPNAKVIQY